MLGKEGLAQLCNPLPVLLAQVDMPPDGMVGTLVVWTVLTFVVLGEECLVQLCNPLPLLIVQVETALGGMAGTLVEDMMLHLAVLGDEQLVQLGKPLPVLIVQADMGPGEMVGALHTEWVEFDAMSGPSVDLNGSFLESLGNDCFDYLFSTFLLRFLLSPCFALGPRPFP